MKAFVEPSQVADLINYLCSDSASMITGQNIFIDGGYTIK
jgi:enoyl-[acyl-carrier-protein] reductase (NADH)